MELITTAIAIGALWSLIDSTLRIAATETVKETSKPFNIKISNWLQKFTGIEEKNRYQTFLDAYYNAEQRFIQKYGIALAYRTFRQIPTAVDSYRRNPRYVIDILLYKVPIDETGPEHRSDKVREFMDFLRRELWGTELYRSIIEYFNTEEAQDLRKKSITSLSTLAKTVDLSLDAIRVVIAEPPKDFRIEREKYLTRIATTFLEHQLSGLPIYREVKNPLLHNLFVVLDLGFENGGEALNEELEKIFGKELSTSDSQTSDPESIPFWQSGANDSFDNTIFEKNLWLVVLGEPGAGKTTTLKKMSLDYAENAHLGEVNYSGIPIYLPLREYAKERKKAGVGYGLLDFIYDYSKGSLNIPCSDGFFEYYLGKGDNLICFDGLDEVTAVGQRQEIKEVVESFIQLFPKNRIVVTSRVSGYEQAPLTRRLFPHYVVKPLSDEKILSYIRQWYSVRESTAENAENQAKELYEAISKQDRILKLARNPLLLTIISLIHKVEATLPNDRVKLYEKCAEALLNTFESVKQIERRDEEKEYYRFREDLLEAVAYWMQNKIKDQGGREVEVDETDLIVFLTDFLNSEPDFELPKREARQQAESFVSLIQERTGILVEKGKGQYAFIHLTFQEYFAASYICKTYLHDVKELLNTITHTLFEPSWHEVNLLLFGKLGHLSKKMPSVLADILLKDNSEDILHRALQFVTSAIVDNVKFDRSVQDRVFQTWLDIIKRPICETEAGFALDAIQSIRIALNIDEILIKVAQDISQNPRIRLYVTRIYLKESTLPGWVINNLYSIIFDANVDEITLANSMDVILKDQFPLDVRIKFIKVVQKSDFWRKQILALVLHHKIIGIEPPFDKEVEPIKEYLSVELIDEIPEFILVFAHLGIAKMWEKFLWSINQPEFNSQMLDNILFKTPSLFWNEPFYDEHKFEMPLLSYITVPEDLKGEFINSLLNSLDQPMDALTKISILQWLQKLRTTNEKVLISLLTIDKNYNISFSSFFVDYFKGKGFDKKIDLLPSELKHLTERILNSSSMFVKLSYFDAIKNYFYEPLWAKTFIEWIGSDEISIENKYTIVVSWGYESLKNSKVINYVQSWLNLSDGWEQAFIADLLIRNDKINRSAIQIILKQLYKINTVTMINELIRKLISFGADDEAMIYAKDKIGLHQSMSIEDRMFRGLIYNALLHPDEKNTTNSESID
jgi:hypothetical protein